MSAIDPKAVHLRPKVEQQFWDAVRFVLRELDSDPDLADRYRAELDDAPFDQKVLALREDPADLAAHLAGSHQGLTDAALERYRRFLSGLGWELNSD